MLPIDDPASIWDAVVGQIFLGSEPWIREMRKEIESALRSDDHPRPQREIGRPNMVAIISAVARACTIEEDKIRHGHGGMPRKVAAWLGCCEGLLRRRSIAAGLRLASSGRASDLIRECDREIDRNPLLRATIDRCCDLLRASPRLPLTTLTASPAVLR